MKLILLILAILVAAYVRHQRPAPLDRDVWPEGVGTW